MTPEQQARDILERMGVRDAQSFTAGDLAELANLIARKREPSMGDDCAFPANGNDGLSIREHAAIQILTGLVASDRAQGGGFVDTAVTMADALVARLGEPYEDERMEGVIRGLVYALEGVVETFVPGPRWEGTHIRKEIDAALARARGE
jgi:hypothetical protein